MNAFLTELKNVLLPAVVFYGGDIGDAPFNCGTNGIFGLLN